jgi:uncharacterized membrane protein YeaQ/YmgE (transglycosylase-associated protein family)
MSFEYWTLTNVLLWAGIGLVAGLVAKIHTQARTPVAWLAVAAGLVGAFLGVLAVTPFVNTSEDANLTRVGPAAASIGAGVLCILYVVVFAPPVERA